MSTPNTIQDFIKALPTVNSLSGRTLLSSDVQGNLGRQDNTSVCSRITSTVPDSAISGGWFRIAKLCSLTSTSSATVLARFIIRTPWLTTASRLLTFMLSLNTAKWDWSQGNVHEGFVIKKEFENNAVYTKARLVVEYNSSNGTVYLEIYTAETKADYCRPYILIEPIIGSPEPMTAVAGSVPSGALSCEAVFGGG